jgi:hypothetical protein
MNFLLRNISNPFFFKKVLYNIITFTVKKILVIKIFNREVLDSITDKNPNGTALLINV